MLEYTLTLKVGTRERCRDEPRDAISYALLVKELSLINYNEFCDKEYSCSFSFPFTYSTKREVKENEFYGGYGYGYGAGHGSSFALIVVLFILLIIIGASWAGHY